MYCLYSIPRFKQIVTARGKVGFGIRILSPLEHKTFIDANIAPWQPNVKNTSLGVNGNSGCEYL